MVIRLFGIKFNVANGNWAKLTLIGVEMESAVWFPSPILEARRDDLTL
jgi:hypothetical protein